MDRAGLANRTTRLMGGKNRPTLFFAAFVVLVIVLIVGMVIASHVARMREDLMQSRIIAAVASPTERSKATHIFADPESYELLLKYINSMGGLVENMEISPKWNISQFAALVDAAKMSGVTILDFTCEQASKLEISCQGPDEAAVQSFIGAIAAGGQFQEVNYNNSDEGFQGYFTVTVYF